MNRIFRHIAAALLPAAMLLSFPGCAGKQAAEAAPSVAETTTAPSAAQTQPGVQTVLLMSLADYPVPENAKTLRNDKQADFILLMTIDADAKTTTAVQISPELPVSFRYPGAEAAETLRLGEVYTYGSGGSDSNLNILTAVSGLMDSVKIDHYMTFAADSVSILADMLGGVTVSVTDSFPEAYPELAAGGSVRLDGKTADVFFNYLAPEDSDQTAHMGRQQAFLRSVYGEFSARAGQDEFVTQLSMKLGKKMNTDLTLSQMLRMLETLQEYQLDDAIQIRK